MILTNANIFTATSSPIQKDTSLRISNGCIDALNVSPDSDEDIVDINGRWVTPGFIDSHVHLSLDGRVDPYEHSDLSIPEQTAVAVENAQKQLRAGFTTVRDCGSRANIDIGIRDAIESTNLTGPRICAAGRPLGITGGHGSFLDPWECDGQAEFRHATRANIRDGADLIKVIATGGVITEGSEPGAQAMGNDELATVVNEAHRAGKPVAAHAHGASGIEAAIEAGVDTVEHCTYATKNSLDMMETSDIGYVSTIISTIVQTTDEAIEDGVRRHVTQKANDALEAQLETFRTAQEHDISLVVGTDAGTPRNPHGNGGYEFEQFVERGVDPVDALRAGTSVAANLIGIGDKVGTLEPGARADLVVLPGDPIADITNTIQPDMVFKRGTIVVEGSELV